MSDRTIKVFISAPSDVRPERLLASRIVNKLALEFVAHFAVEPVMWEQEPLVASEAFQDGIPRASSADIVVVIMWTRLGSPLPDQYTGPISGKHPVTGTEYEFEDGLASAREKQRPCLLFYRKTAVPQLLVNLADSAGVQDHLAQIHAAEAFIARWFDSDGSAAFHRFADAASFEELLEIHLRATLRKLIAGGQENSAGPRWHRGSPYRGLERFEADHAQVFFGRTTARAKLRELLGAQAANCCAFVAVVGASGAGKSSLVLAGLLPDLKLPGMIGRVAVCRQAVMRPSDQPGDPVAALAQAILQALPEMGNMAYRVDDFTEQLRAHPPLTGFAIRQGLNAALQSATPPVSDLAEARLVLVVDQLEELFTQPGLSHDAIDSFAAALEAMARSDLAWVIVTLRSDFADRIEAHPRLAALCEGPARYLLLPPNAAEIGQIIVGPAREAGLSFESDPVTGTAMDEFLREAAVRQPGVLPLLEFTLQQLWHGRTTDGLMTFATYNELQGLEGAIGRRADETLQALPEDVGEALPTVLRAMVTVGQGAQGRVAARDARLSLFPPETPSRRLVDAFQAPDARLLVADPDGKRIRVAHEALLTHWPTAVALIARERADLQLRAKLEMAEAEWHEAAEADRPSLLLHAGLPLSAATDLVARRGSELEQRLQAFVAASQAAEEAATHRRNAEERARLEAEQAVEREQLLRAAELQRHKAEASAAQARNAARLVKITAGAAAVLLVLLGATVVAAVYASQQRHRAEIERDRAQQITAAAEQAANGLVVDLAIGLRDRAGIPIDAIEKLLNNADTMMGSINRLAPDDRRTQRLQATALNEFAKTYLHAGRSTAALQAAQRGAALLRGLLRQGAENADLMIGLTDSDRWIGESFKAQGNFQAALQANQAWLQIATRLTTASSNNISLQQNLASAMRAIGDVQYAEGNQKSALQNYRQSLDIMQRILKQMPNDDMAQLNVSTSEERIGDALDKLNDAAGALAAYQADLKLRQPLLARHPNNTSYLRAVDVAYGDIGDELAAMHRYGEALKEYNAGMSLGQQLADADPGNMEWKFDMAIGFMELGEIQRQTSNYDGAAAAYRSGVVIAEALITLDPANFDWLHQNEALHYALAGVLGKTNDLQGARLHATRCLDIARSIVRDHPDSPDSASDLQAALSLVKALSPSK